MRANEIPGRQERERIRLAFFRAYRNRPGFSSVAVRRHPDSKAWCLHVAITDDLDLPAYYEELPVITYRSGVAQQALAYSAT